MLRVLRCVALIHGKKTRKADFVVEEEFAVAITGDIPKMSF
jgi:hypothetical protein